MRIGWMDKNVPMDTDVDCREIFHTDIFRRARKHLSIERGGKKAVSHAHRLVRLLRRIERIAERDYGARLDVYTTNQTSAPKPWDDMYGYGIEVRLIRDWWIIADFRLYSGYEWQGYAYSDVRGGDGKYLFRGASRADVLLRRVIRRENYMK